MEHNVRDTNVMGEINVPPMVDVMLVLLIIFMVVTPSLLAGFNAQLPTGKNLKERPEEEERTTLGIDRETNYYLNKKPIPKEQAVALLTAEAERHPDDRVLFVKADRTLKYKELIAAMEVAREAGFRVLAAVTESTAPEEDENGNSRKRH
jgi:biopolymer transport protein ExbD